MHTWQPRTLRQINPKPAVTKRIPQPRSELSPRVRTYEAKLLAVMLRTSRLTWVFGEPGTDKSALLKSGVMPLLQRRYADRAAACRRSPPPFPARTGVRQPMAGSRRAGSRRRSISMTWGDTPLARLKSRIDDIVPCLHAPGGRRRCGWPMPWSS